MAERKRRSTKKKKEEQEVIEETQVEENENPVDQVDQVDQVEPTKEELFQTALVDCLITRARMPEAEAKELIERLGLLLESRADIVKIFSDDIISIKMKFREFKRRFIQNNK